MRYSKQRDLIFKIITNSCEHLTAESIYEKAKLEISNISLGTVYRNLSELVSANMIKHVPVSNSKDVYDKTLTEHYHFTCLECGKIEDINIKFDTTSNEMYNEIDIVTVDLMIKGYCHNCKERK